MQIKLANGETAESIVLVDTNGSPLLVGGQNVIQNAAPLAGETVVMTDNAIDGTLLLKPSTSTPATVVFTIASGQNALAGEQVVLGGTVYTFVAAVALPYDVKIGANETASGANLTAAINGAAGAGTLYGTGTAAHPTVSATDHLDGTVTMTARSVGTGGNSIQSLESGADLSFNHATLTGGTTSTGTIATATVTLPTDANSRLGQIRRIVSTKIITALTIDGAATILNTITTLAAGASVSFQKVDVDTWARI